LTTEEKRLTCPRQNPEAKGGFIVPQPLITIDPIVVPRPEKSLAKRRRKVVQKKY
jgi:hypothetical protein